jgi:AcrR family transcriptional regulator
MGDAARQLMPRPERRAQLLRAAAGAFADAGFSATSMDDVARAAGITKLIVYRHFESKAELYRAILDEVATRLGQEWQTRTIEEHTRGGATRVLLTVAREHPDGFRLLFMHAAREPEFAEYRSQFRTLQLAAAASIIDPLIVEAVQRAWATALVVDVVEASVLRWLEFGDPDRDEDFADQSTAALTALVGSIVIGHRPAPS